MARRRQHFALEDRAVASICARRSNRKNILAGVILQTERLLLALNFRRNDCDVYAACADYLALGFPRCSPSIDYIIAVRQSPKRSRAQGTHAVRQGLIAACKKAFA